MSDNHRRPAKLGEKRKSGGTCCDVVSSRRYTRLTAPGDSHQNRTLPGALHGRVNSPQRVNTDLHYAGSFFGFSKAIPMINQIDVPRHRSTALLIFVALLSLQSVGCDLGVYGNRYRARLPELTERSEASQLLMPSYTELAGVGGSLRLPATFENSARYDANNVAIAPNRAQPPGIAIPGLQFALEQYFQDPSGMQYPVYFYAAKVDGATDIEAVKAAVNENVAEKISDKPSWKKVTLESLKGQATSWEAVSFGTAQPFQSRPANAPSADSFDLQTLEGKLLFYLRPTEGGVTILAWRYPSQIADQLGFPAAIDASVGTLR
jgi:hypothetical protein